MTAMHIKLRLAALLAASGRRAILRRRLPDGGDPWQPELQLVDFPLRAIVRRTQPAGDHEEIAEGAWQAEIAAASLPIEPLPGDLLLLEGRSLTVVAVETGRAGETVLIHSLRLRG